MGLSSYFSATIGRTSIDEFLKVLSVVSGDWYVLYDDGKSKYGPRILKNGIPIMMNIDSAKEENYDDGHTNGEKLSIFCSLDWPLSGKFEHYFDNLKKAVEVMGMSSYSIYSEYDDDLHIKEEFKESNYIKTYLDAYHTYMHAFTLHLIASNISSKSIFNEIEWLDKNIMPLISEDLEKNNKKAYYAFGLKLNMLIFIFWCYNQLGYTSIEEIKQKFGSTEAKLYRDYIQRERMKEQKNPLSTLFGVEKNYNYERGLGLLLKNIK